MEIQRGASFVSRIKEAVNAYNDAQQLAAIVMKAADGNELNSDDCLAILSIGAQHLGGGLRGPKTSMAVSNLPSVGDGWVKLKGAQGWKDAAGNIWKKDKKHKDHWDVSDRKGNKVKEIDFNGNLLWPDGPKKQKMTNR